MTENEHFDVAIVGGGFCGTCLAYHLLRTLPEGREHRLAVFEPRGELGAGIAYGTRSPLHLLNVRAAGMSVSASEPASFVDWLAREGGEWGADHFAPRALYRRYLNDTLSGAERRFSKSGKLERMAEYVEAVTPEPSGYALRLAAGGTVFADNVVLAVGNLPFSSRAAENLRSPWDSATYSEVRDLRTLAIVGSGLTALDIILEAEARGFPGKHILISRHGRLPESHAAAAPLPAAAVEWAKTTVAGNAGIRRILASFRKNVNDGMSWRALIDSLRPHSAALWTSLGDIERRRFLRHLRSIWDVHRHRAPEPTLRTVRDLAGAGRLETIKARVIGARLLPSGGTCLTMHGGDTAELEVDLAVNGMGLFSDVRRTESPLIQELLRLGYAVPDSLGVGIAVDANGQLLSASGAPMKGLFTLGALRRGGVWESTAVPELRAQASAIADVIANESRARARSVHSGDGGRRAV